MHFNQGDEVLFQKQLIINASLPKENEMIAVPIQPTKVVSYGSFLAVILSKKSSPGDGIFGRGVKGM
ncbi:hypothetical protein [Burkholderia sp. Bp8963]|uniref:lariocidin family lasso peptide n=1 Tax=Burkholderia sp. Bp8963 TaxID=2184547 RepID=UPI000F5A9307|nr:hypothetical protein [Burkholderia sp. Bp8963]